MGPGFGGGNDGCAFLALVVAERAFGQVDRLSGDQLRGVRLPGAWGRVWGFGFLRGGTGFVTGFLVAGTEEEEIRPRRAG